MATAIDKSIFRSYDIRGIYPAQINEKTAEAVGKGFGTFMRGKRIIVGRDVRTSGHSLQKRLVKGLVSTGAAVTDIGIVPTPVLYFSVSKYGFDGGVVVSASHNPPEWNGLKMCRENALPVGLGSGLEKVEQLISNNKFIKGKGTYETKKVIDDYSRHVVNKIRIARRVTMGVDPGNGAYSGLATSIIKMTTAHAEAINDVQDGRFPSRMPNPTPETIGDLCSLVKNDNLEFGVAYDADGDRSIFVDERGEVVSTDIILALLLKEFLGKGEHGVYEVSCSSVVEEAIREKKGIPVMTRTGTSNIMTEMSNPKAVIGGELSGHLYFNEMYKRDDGLFASLKVAEMLSNSNKSLSELVSELPKYKRHVEEIPVEDSRKFQLIEQLKHGLEKNGKIVTLDGVKLYTKDGWLLLRASNTSPAIRLIIEARDSNGMKSLLGLARERLDIAYPGTHSVAAAVS